MSLVFAFVVALMLAVVFTPLAGAFARARGLYVLPSIDRWHRRPVPDVGGVAMIAALLPACLLTGIAQPLMPLLVASTLMFAIGLVDDVRPLGPPTKFVLQMLVASVLLYLLPDLQITGHALADRLIGFVWILTITNAVNLLDNMDGLAAGVTLLASGSLLVVLAVQGVPIDSVIGLALVVMIGVTAGFLLFNSHPASIFMGDGGSHLLGCLLAGISLMATTALADAPVPVAAIPVLVLLVPMFDTVFVTLSRGLAGRSAFSGGRDHTSHRLAALGMGERSAVCVLYALTVVGGATAVGLLTLPAGLAWGLVALYGGLLGLVGVYLGRVETSGLDPSAPQSGVSHRLYEVALDTLLIAAAYYLAFLARFHDHQFEQFLPYFTRSVPVVIGVQIAALWLSGKYRRPADAADTREIFRLVRASLLGVAASVIAVLYMSRFVGYSRWVFLLDAGLMPAFIVGARLAIRAVDSHLRRRRSHGRAVLIYGAGKGGTLAAQELIQNPSLGLLPVGFIDDDPAAWRARPEGLPVVGDLDSLGDLIDRSQGEIAGVVVAISELPANRLDRVCEIAASRGVVVRRLRFDIEEVHRGTRPGGILRFPGA